MLANIGIKNIKFDLQTILAVLGRLVIAPAVMILLIRVVAPAMGLHLAHLMANTFIIQSATPALAVLPILADQGNGDKEYATNVVALTTLLFVIVVPALMLIAG